MSYNSSSIKVLKGLEACRKRPGMYIGNTQDGSGLHHMIYEVLDNSIDEHLAKHCSEIKVTIHENNWISVEDNGRGIPVDIHEEEGISAAIVIMTQLHAGGKFDQDSYKISGGLHGVGVSVVNALSENLELTVWKDKKEYKVNFEKGILIGDLEEIGPTKKNGTKVSFFADKEIFGEILYDLKTIQTKIEQVVYLNPGLKILLEDQRNDFSKEYFEPEGIVSFVKHLTKDKNSLHEIIKFEHEEGSMYMKGAAVWVESYSETVLCFANIIPQKDGGTHLVGLRTAFTRSINNYIQKDAVLSKKLKNVQLTGDDIREGIVCVLAVYLPEPQFASQTKEKLISSNIRPVVEAGVSSALEAWFEENPNDAKKVVQKIVNAATAREAARKSRELVRNNKSTEFSLSMATKLAGCTQKDPTKAELFIVEGDSAGGSTKMARDRLFQAVLPLRGKILNVEKAGINRALNDEGIRTLIAVMGTGIGETFDITKIRYNKIILMADADIDGSHILTLLITFFFMHMRPIIENGYLYVAQPPLYGIKIGQKMHYLINDEALAEFLLERNLDKLEFKKNNEIVDNIKVKEFLKSLFVIAPDIKARGILFEAIVCAKIVEFEEENIDVVYENLLAHLKELKAGNWHYEIEEENAVFINEKNSLIYKYIFNSKTINKKYYQFIYKWQDFWGENAKFTYDGEEKIIKNPIEIYDLFKKKGSADFHIQRYKGLGEMDADDLGKSAMQSYLQVRYENEAEAEELIGKLMGEDVLPRKEFIDQMDPVESDD